MFHATHWRWNPHQRLVNIKKQLRWSLGMGFGALQLPLYFTRYLFSVRSNKIWRYKVHLQGCCLICGFNLDFISVGIGGDSQVLLATFGSCSLWKWNFTSLSIGLCTSYLHASYLSWRRGFVLETQVLSCCWFSSSVPLCQYLVNWNESEFQFKKLAYLASVLLTWASLILLHRCEYHDLK